MQSNINDTDTVVLVDNHDNETGRMGKLDAHVAGLLHRAVSVFIFNSSGQLLVHKRAAGKYHSAGLWTNTCCSHPRPGETAIDAATRRLNEEMGLKCDLRFAFHITYRAELDNGLTEHELDHVFVGTADAIPNVDPEEASDWKYMGHEEINQEIVRAPEMFTVWFRLIYPKVAEYITT